MAKWSTKQRTETQRHCRVQCGNIKGKNELPVAVFGLGIRNASLKITAGGKCHTIRRDDRLGKVWQYWRRGSASPSAPHSIFKQGAGEPVASLSHHPATQESSRGQVKMEAAKHVRGAKESQHQSVQLREQPSNGGDGGSPNVGKEGIQGWDWATNSGAPAWRGS